MSSQIKNTLSQEGIFVFELFLDLHLKAIFASGALDRMLAHFFGQAQDRLALGTGAKDMGCGVSRTGNLLFAEQAILQAQKGSVFGLPLDNVAGKTTKNGPAEEGKGDDIEGKGQIGEGFGDNTKDGKDRARKQEGDLNDEEKIIQLIGAVTAVEKFCDTRSEIHGYNILLTFSPSSRWPA